MQREIEGMLSVGEKCTLQALNEVVSTYLGKPGIYPEIGVIGYYTDLDSCTGETYCSDTIISYICVLVFTSISMIIYPFLKCFQLYQKQSMTVSFIFYSSSLHISSHGHAALSKNPSLLHSDQMCMIL